MGWLEWLEVVEKTLVFYSQATQACSCPAPSSGIKGQTPPAVPAILLGGESEGRNSSGDSNLLGSLSCYCFQRYGLASQNHRRSMPYLRTISASAARLWLWKLVSLSGAQSSAFWCVPSCCTLDHILMYCVFRLPSKRFPTQCPT